MVYYMKMDELAEWVKTKAQLGDVACSRDRYSDRRYLYVYRGSDDKPYWRMLQDDIVDKYLEEINKLKVEESKMNKRCDNCKHFKNVPGSFSWCSHKEHAGMYVPKFTSCPEHTHAPKEEKHGPFDNIKFYIKDSKTGEVEARYVCEDCGKEMKAPYRWWMKVPYGNAVPDDIGYHYRCEECDKKKED